jgi:hypothetical protein
MKPTLNFRKFCLSVLYSLIIIVPANSHASSISTLNKLYDTAGKNNKPWKKNENEFLSEYGKDDSSRALIRFFFDRRKLARRLILIPFAIDLTFASALGIYVLVRMGAYLSYPWAIASLFLIFASITLFIVAAATGMRYSRKRLYYILLKYESGYPLSTKWAKKNRFFKRYILQGK